MPEKVRTARFSLGVAGYMCIASAALFLFIFISGLAAAGRGNGTFQLVRHMLPGTMTLVLFFISAVLGLACFIVSSKISRRQPSARLAGLALGILLLPLFPFGTVPGIFVVSGLAGREAGQWFGTGRAARGCPPAGKYSAPSRNADATPEGEEDGTQGPSEPGGSSGGSL